MKMIISHINKTQTLLFIVFIVSISSCKKQIVENEIIIDRSKVISQNFLQSTKYSVQNGLHSKKYISEVRDSIIYDNCDLNFDGIFDISFGYELKNLNKNDSLILEAFIEKSNADFEFLFKKSDNMSFLTPYYDTNNYIGPSSNLWGYQGSINRFIISNNLLEECTIDNVPQLCIKSKNGFYSPPYQSFDGYYYQGFRFKNKVDKGNWNYGYFVISYSALSFEIEVIAYESTHDFPIGLRKVF